jgi:D-amino-acid oxidase
MNITVVGAGVIGLSTALALEARGASVTILAKERGDATTSAVAGAVWFPYRAGPRDLVAAWAQRTRAWLVEIARRDPSAGVDILDGYEIDESTTTPWWGVGLPEIEHVTAPVTGAPRAWKFLAPRVEPAVFLPWLESHLYASIIQREVSDLHALPGDVIVNCTGLGARMLANDTQLEPLLGQIAVAQIGSTDIKTTITDERNPDEIFYIIPRRTEVVLGGCSIPTMQPPVISEAITDRILAHAKRLGIKPGTVIRQRAGLRPYRPTVRLERDPFDDRIVHNYGHGGAGFTLSRGCAEAVADLVYRIAK